MENFIKLTNRDKHTVYVNTRNLVSFNFHKEGSVITTLVPVETWGINQLIVLESPEKILELIAHPQTAAVN